MNRACPLRPLRGRQCFRLRQRNAGQQCDRQRGAEELDGPPSACRHDQVAQQRCHHLHHQHDHGHLCHRSGQFLPGRHIGNDCARTDECNRAADGLQHAGQCQHLQRRGQRRQRRARDEQGQPAEQAGAPAIALGQRTQQHQPKAECQQGQADCGLHFGDRHAEVRLYRRNRRQVQIQAERTKRCAGREQHHAPEVLSHFWRRLQLKRGPQ